MISLSTCMLYFKFNLTRPVSFDNFGAFKWLKNCGVNGINRQYCYKGPFINYGYYWVGEFKKVLFSDIQYCTDIAGLELGI